MTLYIHTSMQQNSHMKISPTENYILYLMGCKLYINGSIFKGDGISSVTISCNFGAISIKVTSLYKWTAIPWDSETFTCSAIAYNLRLSNVLGAGYLSRQQL